MTIMHSQQANECCRLRFHSYHQFTSAARYKTGKRNRMLQRRNDHASHRNPATHLASPRRFHRSFAFEQDRLKQSATHATVQFRLLLESAMIGGQNRFRLSHCVQWNTNLRFALEPVHIWASPRSPSFQTRATGHLTTRTRPKTNNDLRHRL